MAARSTPPLRRLIKGDRFFFFQAEDVMRDIGVTGVQTCALPILRASMAIPEVFTPVRKDSMVLVDGGMVNNYPVDVAKAMGADIVIGVDVQKDLKRVSELNSASDILGQIIDLACQANHDRHVDLTDAYIQVDRSEEHTSELQSRQYLVCRLLLEK